MSYYPSLPDEEDYSLSSAPVAPSSSVFQYAQDVQSNSDDKTNPTESHDMNQEYQYSAPDFTPSTNVSAQYPSITPTNLPPVPNFTSTNLPSVPNFNSFSDYSAPPVPQPSGDGDLEYAPPLHTVQPQNKPPPQWMPSCIPNPQRVSYENPCYIVCGKNGLYLNVNQVIHDCPVNAWSKVSSLQQKWYFTKDGYIELAADRTFVLDCRTIAVGAQLVIGKKRIPPNGNLVDPSVVSQKWNVVSAGPHNYICNVQKPNLVIELAGSTPNYERGDLIRINSNLSTNNDHQKWAFPSTTTGQTKESNLFPIGSKCYIYGADSGLYLTVKVGLLGKVKAGTPVYVSKGKLLSGAKTQQWIFDKDGFLMSALDKTGNLVLDCKSGQCGEELFLNTRQFTNNLHQKWLVKQPTAAPTDAKKALKLKACRIIYSQMNTNLVIDEKGVNEAAFVNFSRNSSTQFWKIKTC